jgi:DNA-binding response OmpR family regulator
VTNSRSTAYRLLMTPPPVLDDGPNFLSVWRLSRSERTQQGIAGSTSRWYSLSVSPWSEPAEANVVNFGAFELDLRARELRKHGRRMRLPEQSVQILAMLLEQPRRVVLREESRRNCGPTIPS